MNFDHAKSFAMHSKEFSLNPAKDNNESNSFFTAPAWVDKKVDCPCFHSHMRVIQKILSLTLKEQP